MIVYLSSTLDDLRPERAAVKEVLAGEAVVKESYGASEQDLVGSLREEVALCDLYIGILALRYGFIPPRERQSVTHIEYDAAKAKGIPRFVFLKDPAAISFTQTDSAGHKPLDSIEQFRALVSSGDPEEPRPAVFKTPDELKVAVQKAVSDYRSRRSGTRSLMTGGRVHGWEIKYNFSIGGVPGSDDALIEAFRSCARADSRMRAFEVSPSIDSYLQALDDEARRSRFVLLLVTPRSLSRIADAPAGVSAAIALVRDRRAARLGVLAVGLGAGALAASPLAAIGDVIESTDDEWAGPGAEAAIGRLRRWCRERVPERQAGGQVGIPYLTLALSQAEAEQLRDAAGPIFAKFGEAATTRRSGFSRLSQGLANVGLKWPEAFYGVRREDWRPFGANNPTIEEFVDKSIRKVNAAPVGSRERRLLGEFRLVPHRYRFDEYLNDAAGSRDNLRRVCDAGCLVLVDEFALLHPDLRPAIDALLASNNAAVVSLSACDPLPIPLRDLLGDVSYLRVGNLLARFQQAEDVRCELALNCIERLQRWLRLVLPEVMATLAEAQGSPELVSRVDELLGPGAP